MGLFHRFLKDTATGLGVPAPPALASSKPLPTGVPVGDSAADVVGARLVGRWSSGAPVERTVHPHKKRDPDPIKNDQDNPFLAIDDCANNNFEFQEATEPLPPTCARNEFDCVDMIDPTAQEPDKPFEPAVKDDVGALCPFTGHIRKAYPRDDKPLVEGTPLRRDGMDVTDEEGDKIVTNEDDTQTHRILRRGIPFGAASNSTPANPSTDARDNRPPDKYLTRGRGLLFFAYQTSIEDQFEFIIRNWVNNPDFKEPKGPASTAPAPDEPKKQGGGHDPIIGQNNSPRENRVRTFTVTFKDNAGTQKTRRVSTEDNTGKGRDWVIPTGGEYFFAPSIEAIGLLSKS